ncbi:MAG: DUF4163 domain-containing protein [Eubacteriaceae bacterium]|nr:DUF4163 domain-containing protein [Eubacteriaceae bacterium]
MKRKLAIICALLTMCTAVGCKAAASTFSAVYETANAQETSLLLTTEKYQLAGVTIEYPVLSNYPDAKAQDKINNAIEKAALGIIKSIDKNASLQVGYKVALVNSSIISIVFLGDASSPGWAHPANIAYSANISVPSGKMLRLADFYKIDKEFTDCVLYNTYAGEAIEALDYLKAQDTKQLAKLLKKADKTSSSEVHSAITENSLLLMVPVPHVLGDYAKFEVPYHALYPYEKK